MNNDADMFMRNRYFTDRNNPAETRVEASRKIEKLWFQICVEQRYCMDSFKAFVRVYLKNG